MCLQGHGGWQKVRADACLPAQELHSSVVTGSVFLSGPHVWHFWLTDQPNAVSTPQNSSVHAARATISHSRRCCTECGVPAGWGVEHHGYRNMCIPPLGCHALGFFLFVARPDVNSCLAHLFALCRNVNVDKAAAGFVKFCLSALSFRPGG